MNSPALQIPISTPSDDGPLLDAVACELETPSRLAHQLTQRIDVQIAAFRSQAREARRPFEERNHG